MTIQPTTEVTEEQGLAPDPVTNEGKVESVRAPKRVRFVFLRNAKAATGVGILLFFSILAVIGPWIAPYDPNKLGPDIMQGPSADWLGTTNTGQDILSQILVGTRGVMIVGFSAGIIATALAVLVGVTAGFVGGVGDDILSALSNVFLVIPALPLIIIVTGQLPTSSEFTIAFNYWLGVGSACATCSDAVVTAKGLRTGGARKRRIHATNRVI